MPRKKLSTRKLVNNSVIDNALKDVYDKIDKLLPITQEELGISNFTPMIGTTTFVENSEGHSSIAIYTKNGWQIDINSQYEVVNKNSFVPLLSTKGRSRKIIKGEALSYDDKGSIPISSKSGKKLLIKNDSNILKVRNAADTADGDIEVANIRDSNSNVVMEINAISGTKTDHIKFTNAITGTGAYPTIEPAGDSTNKSIQIKGRGTGNVYIQTTNSASSVGFQDNTDAVRLVADPENKKFRILGQATKYAELDSDTSGELRIATYDVDNNVTTGHIKLSACDDIYLAAGGDNIYLNGGGDQDDATFDIGTTFGFFDFGTASTCKLSSANNYDLNLIGMGDGDITLDAGGDVIFDAATGIHKFLLAGDADDLCTLTVAANGATTIATADSDGTTGHLTLDVNGGLYIDVDSGAARITSGGSTFTPTHSTDLVTKAYVDGATYMKHTAVWGGELPRIGGSGTWFGIPTGHNLGALQMGTGSSPDTSYTVSTTADDLVACIWASMHDITVTGCKIWVGQGGATNTAHNVSLMRYDIDADGDLSNGVEVGSGGSINNDDYSQARAHTMTLTGTAADLDIDFSDGQILIAFVEPAAAYNAYMAAKVILEYTEVMT